MRGAFVGTVGALAIAASLFGLALDSFRAGPFDRPLEPVAVPVAYEAMMSRSSAEALGLCLTPPCPTTTEVEARFEGLPAVPYAIRLEGSTDTVELGTYEPVDGVVQVQWRGEEDVDRLVFAVAGREVGSLPISGFAALVLSWDAEPASLHVNEIGGVTLSSVATTRLDEAPPPGWEFRARFEGPRGVAAFGALDADGESAVLDGRLERLRLEDHEWAVIVVAPVGAEAGAGFPVLRADLWP